VTDLESHNDQLIADLPSELRQRQSQILKYVMYTMRPLKVTELAAACGYLNDRDLISGSSDDTNASLDARTKPLMQELSKYGQMLRVSDPDDTVDFSHPSIRKYLVRKSLNLPSSLKPFLAPEHTAKLEIAVTCIGFLKSVSVMKGIPEPWMQNFALRVRRFDEKVPLYSYALRYWDIHIREAIELSTHDLKHKATLLQYLQSIRGVIKSQPHSEFVRQLTNPRGRSMFINPPEVMTDLDFFAAMGISSQVETILGIDYSKPKSALTRFSPTSEVVAIAARSAAHNGHQHTFELLFDLLKPGPYTDQILHGVLENAVHGGDLAIIRRVLRHYTPSPTELIKAVMKAVAAGDSLTLDALQSCEDAMKATDKAGRNVMHHLALRHIDVNGFFDEELFKQAYEYFDSAGVPIRTQDFYGDTPLHHITLDHKKGFEMVIRTLIELGVDPAAKNRRGQTALHFASWRGSAKAVAALLEYVPESQAIGKSAGDLTPLHWAMNRHDYDVNVGTTDSEDGYHVVQALIHLGASFDAKSTEGRTPLTIAAENPDVAALVWRFASAGALDCTLLSACFGQPREAITGSDYPSYIKRDQRISQRVQELDDYDTEQRMESRWAFTKRLTWNSDKLDYESVTDANMIGDLSKEFEEEFRTEEASRGLFWHDL
jgi:ankyrin repeat protein